MAQRSAISVDPILVAAEIGSPVRVQILRLLGEHRELAPVDAAELLGEAGASLSALAYHFRTLRTQKLIRVSREERRRGAIKGFYVLTARGERVRALLSPAG